MISSDYRPASVSKLLPYLALLFAIVSLGLSGIFVKWADVPGAVSGFYRMGIAAIAMMIPFGVEARRRRPRSSRHVWLAVLAGLFFAGDLVTWNTSVLITSAANATLLGNTSPLWVSLGAMILFKEKLRPPFWAGLGLALLGAILILGQDFLSHPTLGLADVLAVVAGVFYAAFFLAAERAREGLSSLTSWWISAITSTLILFGLSQLLDQPLTGYPSNSYWSLIGLALITQVGGYLAINYALGHLKASIVSPTLLGQPILTAILAVPLLNQPLTLLQIIGGAVVLAGVWIVHRHHRR